HVAARARVLPRPVRGELELGARGSDVQRGPDHLARDLLPEVLHPECREQRDQGLGRNAMTISLHDIEAARLRISDAAIRTPLVRLGADAPAEIYLKLENLQP